MSKQYTVKELIEELSKFKPDDVVIIRGQSNGIFSHEGYCVAFNDTIHLFPEAEYEIQKWCKIYKLKDGESVVKNIDRDHLKIKKSSLHQFKQFHKFRKLLEADENIPCEIIDNIIFSIIDKVDIKIRDTDDSTK